MRHFILVTHANLAKGFQSTLEMIIGKQDKISYYCAYIEDYVCFKHDIEQEIASYDEGTDIIILTDIFGGSVNNELMDLSKVNGIHLISGVNLCLIISLLLDESDLSTNDMIIKNIEEAKQGMVYCNKFNDEVFKSLDEF